MKLFVLRAVGACLIPTLALAQSSDKTAAVTLYDEAQKLMEAGKYSAACPKYAESNRLDPQLGALLHLADCYEKSQQLASAWTAFRDAAELADRRADERSLTAKERAQTLESRLNRLTIAVPAEANVPGLTVRRDGVVVSQALWGVAVPVDSGAHSISVTAPGKQEWRQTVEVGSQKKSEAVTVPVLSDEAPPVLPAPPASGTAPVAVTNDPKGTADTTTPGNSWMVPAGWTGLGLGVAGAGIGVAYQLTRKSKVDDRDAICPRGTGCSTEEATTIDQLTDDARKANTMSMVGFAAGGAFIAGGVALLLLSPSDSSATPAKSSRTTFLPAIGADYQGVNVTHVW